MPIAGLDRAAIASLAYARSISAHVTAVHAVVDEDQMEQIRTSWQQWQQQIPAEEETHLLLITSPYRTLLGPLLAYIDAVHLRHPQETLTVILPEFVVAHWWEYFRLRGLTDEELLEERSGISGLEFIRRIGGTEVCPIDRYQFPPRIASPAIESETKLGP